MIIFDISVAGCDIEHMTLFNLAVVKKMITMQEKAWPMRPKVIDIFQPNEIKILYTLYYN